MMFQTSSRIEIHKNLTLISCLWANEENVNEEKEASFHPREKRHMNMFLDCGRRWEENELRVEQEKLEGKKEFLYICFVGRKGLLNEKQETDREEEIRVFMVTFFTAFLSLSL